MLPTLAMDHREPLLNTFLAKTVGEEEFKAVVVVEVKAADGRLPAFQTWQPPTTSRFNGSHSHDDLGNSLWLDVSLWACRITALPLRLDTTRGSRKSS